MLKTCDISKLNSEKPIFPVKIFSKPNRDYDSVKDSESHDIKFLT